MLTDCKPAYSVHYGKAESDAFFEALMNLDWETREDAPRDEYFMAEHSGYEYTYGEGRGVRTYVSRPTHWLVRGIMDWLNAEGATYNVCFLNRYVEQRKWLGWHADDSPGMDMDHPISVLSFGAERDINWRPMDYKGVIPDEWRQTLAHGSLFVMPAGFQRTHQHKIPKHHSQCGPRISLTFRHFTGS